MTQGAEVVEDYRALQVSLRAHPLHFLRPELERRGILACGALADVPAGRRVEVAGIILVRQRPGSGNVVFLTIEDETGIANGLLWASRYEAQRVTVLSSAMVGIRGVVQREEQVIHVIVEQVVDYTDLLRAVKNMDSPGLFRARRVGGGRIRRGRRSARRAGTSTEAGVFQRIAMGA